MDSDKVRMMVKIAELTNIGGGKSGWIRDE